MTAPYPDDSGVVLRSVPFPVGAPERQPSQQTAKRTDGRVCNVMATFAAGAAGDDPGTWSADLTAVTGVSEVRR